MPIGAARMPLFDHLGELRMRLVRIVVCLFIAVMIFYWATPTIGNILLLPVQEFLPVDEAGNFMGLQAIDPFEAFATRFKIAIWASIVTCAPVILWQILAFFLPALKPKERKLFIPTFAAAVALFILGTLFCYFFILNAAFQWLTSQTEGLGYLAPRMSSYIDTIVKFEIGFGAAFELPIVVFFLVIWEIVPYKKLRSQWRTVYVVLMVISAMVTPDASPVTMMLLFAAMVAMYEISLLISRILLRKKIKSQNDQIAKEEADESGATLTKVKAKRK